jgi:hypothetical protein
MSATSDLSLRIEHDSGQTSLLTVPTPVAIDTNAVTLASINIERALDRVARAEARVFRSDWLDVLDIVNRRNDQVFIDDGGGNTIFGGRLDDWQFETETVSVLVDSFERDSLDASPPASFSRNGVADDAIASDIIGLVPAPVSAGAIEQTTSSIDFSETHTSPGELLQTLARDTGAEVRYQSDGTVDYLESRGATQSETLSPTSRSVVGDTQLRQTLREETTDIRVVSASDPTISESSVAIPTGSGDRQVFRVERIGSTSTSRLQSRADTLAAEITSAPRYLEIDATVDPLELSGGVSLGDKFPVSLPQYDIGQTLRVIETVRSIDEAGELVDVTLSNRSRTLTGRDGPLAI